MNNLQTPSQPRVPIGVAKLPNGTLVEILLNDEWARYFNSLNNQVVTSARSAAEAAQHAEMAKEASEVADTMPGGPGPQGKPGDMGPALFMLAESADDNGVMCPPAIDNVYVPLKSKDQPDGVPGLTALALNLKNAAGTFVNFFTSMSTAARTWTMPDKDGTVAVLADFASPPAIGNTTAAAGTFTSVTANSGDFSSLTAGPFGCNGQVPQSAAASGGTLAGVISALVANGILSS